VKRLCAAALGALALAAAGCGGGGGGGLPEGASIAPASAIGFVSVNTDFSSARWRKLARLAIEFPALRNSAGILRNFKRFAGNEVDLVWLDRGNSVLITKPRSKARLNEFLHLRGDLFSQGSVGGWAVAGDRDKVDRFEKLASAGDKLADDKDFKRAFEKLDSHSSVRAWVSGDFVQSAVDRSLASSGASPRLTHDVGNLHAISAEAKAESDGASLELDGLIDPAPDPATFSPSLPGDFPDKPVLYVSTTRLDAPLKTVLRLVAKSKPNFDTQLSQVEGVLGVTLENDVYPLLRGESALAVYAGNSRLPDILFVQKVDDEQKADGLLRRISAIAQLSGKVGTGTVELAGTAFQQLTIRSAGVTIYDGVAGGKIIVTNSKDLARQVVEGPPKTLGSDDLFRSARDASGMPKKVAAFAYGDLERGLPVVFGFAQQNGSVVPPEAFENTKPLTAAFVYLVKDGDALRISGFQGIK
jgi:hypothetical protein